jgi:hypothetical protein
MLHHFLTAFLIYFSYTLHQIPIGSIVMLIHDVTDLSVSVFKIFVDVTHYTLQFSAYFQMLFLWIYLRLYYFPIHIIRMILIEIQVFQDELYHHYFAFLIVSFLIILALLHAFWFHIMVKGFLRGLRNKDWRDTIRMEYVVNRSSN